jgi:copper(I)-binding protein
MILMSLLSACSYQEDIAVENAWIPEAPPTVSALAGYLTISNNLSEDIVLVGAQSPYFEEVVFHQTIVDQDTDYARMVEHGPISIRSGESFDFSPGGYHLMLINPLQAVNTESAIPVLLLLANNSRVKVSFEIRPYRLKLEED